MKMIDSLVQTYGMVWQIDNIRPSISLATQNKYKVSKLRG